MIVAAVAAQFMLTTTMAQTTVIFSLDMNQAIEEGWFEANHEKVGIRGDLKPLSWNKTFEARDDNADGIYEASVRFRMKKDSARLSFKIKVDGSFNPEDGWQIGNNHVITLRKNQVTKASLAWGDQPKKMAATFTGDVRIVRNFNSDPLIQRDLFIYLPPGYQDSDARYPVLYMHDGQNIFDASEAGHEWALDETAEQLIQSGEINPMIIVGIGNTSNRGEEYTPTKQHWEYQLSRKSKPESDGTLRAFTGDFTTPTHEKIRFKADADTLMVMIPGSDFWQKMIQEQDDVYYLPQAGIYFDFSAGSDSLKTNIHAYKTPKGGQGTEYGKFIVQTLKPYIDQHYRTLPEKEHTGLGGSSYGGLITLYLGMQYPDVFQNLLIVSPSIWWDGKYILKAYQSLNQAPDQRFWLYIGTGEGKDAIKNFRDLRDALIQQGLPDDHLQYVETKGALHNEEAWSEQAESMLRFIFSY